MTGRTELVVEFEDSSDSVQPTRKVGFFARRRNRKKVRERIKELEKPIERTESAPERVAKARHPRRERQTSPARSQSISPAKAAIRRTSPDLVGNRPRRVDLEAREELRQIRGRREFLRQSAVGAGILALGAGLGYGSGYGQAQGLSGNTRTVITNTEIAARVIGGVRIATEFIPDPVPSGTDADPYPGSAIQAALNDGLHVYVPTGTWRLTSTIARAADGATIIGAGKSTKLVFNGVSPCISAGIRSGWLIANLAVDAGGLDVSLASETRFSEIWMNGILADNRPIGTGAGGAAGYYGVRAADFVTSGDGTPTNPYNASAIQAAINALPSRGGTVFIKEGIWSGPSRISVNKAGRVILRGTGTELSYRAYDGTANWFTLNCPTHIAAGFDCFSPTDFYDMNVSNHQSALDTGPVIKMIIDPTIRSEHQWLGGFTIKRVRVQFGNPGVWMTGQNFLPGIPTHDAWQIWMATMEQVYFDGGVRHLKIDKGDSPDAAQLELMMSEITSKGATGGVGRTFDINIDNIRGTWSNIMLEGDGGASDDYAFYVRLAGSNGGHIIQNVFFGDTTVARKDAYIESIRGLKVLNFMHGKDVDIIGSGHFQFGRYLGSGVVNVNATGEVVVESVPGNTLAVGTLTNPQNILIRRGPLNAGFIGSTLAGASPYTYTNNDAYLENVYLVGGAVTDVSRGGQSLEVKLEHVLAPGDSIVITHAAAPTIRRYGIS